MKRCLSLAGGGMLGVLECQWLRLIEFHTGAAIHELFDLIGGTSTGSILAGLAATPKGVSMSDAMSFYTQSGPRIFRTRKSRSLRIPSGTFSCGQRIESSSGVRVIETRSSPAAQAGTAAPGDKRQTA